MSDPAPPRALPVIFAPDGNRWVPSCRDGGYMLGANIGVPSRALAWPLHMERDCDAYEAAVGVTSPRIVIRTETRA